MSANKIYETLQVRPEFGPYFVTAARRPPLGDALAVPGKPGRFGKLRSVRAD